MLDKDNPLRKSKYGDEVRRLARARTLTVLARLSANHKRHVLRFLYVSGLILKGRIVKLEGDESAVNLKRAPTWLSATSTSGSSPSVREDCARGALSVRVSRGGQCPRPRLRRRRAGIHPGVSCQPTPS
jgi:hypothetical protein